MAMKKQEEEIAESSKECKDSQCPIHGNLKVRGREFRGYVVRKFPRRIAIEFERIIYIRKYERYYKKKTRIHARIARCREDEVKIGDYVKVGECRPLSKIIHFVYLGKVEKNKEAGIK